MAYVPNSNSVAAWLQSDNASVITKWQDSSVISIQQGSVGTVIIGGSIAASFTPPANQSVSGVVGASVIGYPNVNVGGSVVGFQGTSPWVVNFQNSSVLAVPVGSTITVGQGSIAVNIIAGSIAASFTPPANQSVSGTVDIGVMPGSIAAFIKGNASVITVPQGSTAVAIVSGSIAATFTPPANQSVSGTVDIGVMPGSVAAFIKGNASVITVPQGSTAVAIVSGSIAATFTPPANQSVSGTVDIGVIPGSVVTFQGGTQITSLVSTVPSSVIVGASIFGLAPVNVTNTNLNVSGSVAAFVVGNASLITLNQGSSILSVPVGSTVAIIQANSIVGTYAEDAAHTTADKGVFTLGIRNDTVASLTSADADYGGIAVDAVGRTIIKPFAGEDATIISYVGSLVSGSTTLIQASAVGKRSYVTDFSLNNSGSTTTLVTIQGGDTSLLGQFVVPAGGGNNKAWQIPLKTTLSQDLAFKVSPSQSILYATIKGYQAP